MQLAAAILLFILFLGILLKISFFGNTLVSKKKWAIIFAIKMTFGIAFYLVYTIHYTNFQTSDMHKYFKEATRIYELTENHPNHYFSILTGIATNKETDEITKKLDFWYLEENSSVINDSRMVIRFNLLLLPITKGNIYIHCIVAVFISFIGLFLAYKTLENKFERKHVLLLIALLGVPSVLFWSSGIMKESILMLFLGIIIKSAFEPNLKGAFRVFLFAFGFWGIFFSKFYVALALIPSLLFLACFQITKKTALSLAASLILVVLSVVGYNSTHDNLALKKLSKKQNDFINLSIGGVYLVNTQTPFDTIYTALPENLNSPEAIKPGYSYTLKNNSTYHHWKNPGFADTLQVNNNPNEYTVLQILNPTGSAITLKRLEPNFSSVVKLLPVAFVNVFFRPFIFDVDNVFSLLACFENIALFALILLMLFYFKKPSNSAAALILFSLLFVFVLYVLVGITTPVLGAAVRYKVPATPFLLMSIFLCLDMNKIVLKFTFVDKLFRRITN